MNTMYTVVLSMLIRVLIIIETKTRLGVRSRSGRKIETKTRSDDKPIPTPFSRESIEIDNTA